MPKKPGPPGPNNGRGVLLGSQAGKVVGRVLRNQVAPYLAFASLPTQIGGIPSRGIELAHHIATARLASAKRRRVSCACLFVDLSAAFYRTRLADSISVLRGAGAPPLLLELVQAWHTHTWWKVRGDERDTAMKKTKHTNRKHTTLTLNPKP